MMETSRYIWALHFKYLCFSFSHCHFYNYVTPQSKHSYHMTQFELLDTLDKGVQQSSIAKSFLTLDSLQCGKCLLEITILGAQFPQLYSP
jgi:hypothetical protein